MTEETANNVQESQDKKNPDLSVFVDQLKRQPLAKVEFLFKHIDRDSNPQRYEAIKAELDRRRAPGGDEVADGALSSAPAGVAPSTGGSQETPAAKPSARSRLKKREVKTDASGEPVFDAAAQEALYKAATTSMPHRDTTFESPVKDEPKVAVVDATREGAKVDEQALDDFFTKPVEETQGSDSFFSFLLVLAIVVMLVSLYIIVLSLYDLPGKEFITRLLKISEAVAGKTV